MFIRPSQGSEGNGLPTCGLPPRSGQSPTSLQAPEGRAPPVPPWCLPARQRNNVTNCPHPPQMAGRQPILLPAGLCDITAMPVMPMPAGDRESGLGVGLPASGAGRKRGTELESEKGKFCLCATLLCVHTSHTCTKQRSGCANPNFNT